MIAHRDFEPGKRPSFLPKLPEIKAAFEEALASANAWIASESVEVLNVETIGTPDLHPLYGWVRVWYRTTTAKAEPIPEI